MKKSIFSTTFVCLTVCAFISGCKEGTVPPALVGTWVGSASNTHITPSNAPMPLSLTVSTDGSVTGTLGTAVVKNGSIRKNRGKLGRYFNMKSDYLIYADLEGSLVTDKDIRYEGVFININIENDKIVAAGFSTTHSRYGTPITKQGLVRGRITIEKKDPSQQGATPLPHDP
jgi:hypothetical protein